MSHRAALRRRYRTLLFTCILLLGLLPAGMVMADSHRTSTRTPVTFTSTPVEILVPGEEWVDDAGIFHFRGEVSREVVEGDITGELIVTFGGDFIPGPGCDPETECEAGQFSAWGEIVITDENGTWHGTFMLAQAFAPGEEPFDFGETILVGRGGNTGKVLVGNLTPGGDDDVVTFEGFMLTMGVPSSGLNMHSQLCFGEQESAFGAFMATGAIESSGAASGVFFTGGGQWTHTYGLWGELMFSDDNGSLTIEFMGMSQDNWLTSVGWGHWAIVDATGDYENYNGHGKITGHAGEFEQCSSGFGVWLQLSGQIHKN